MIPGLYGRVLIGRDFPYPFLNTMGGDSPGRYVSHQLPFAGIDYMGIFDDALMTTQLQLRYRFGKNHYVFLTGNYGLNDHDFTRILKGRQLYGGSVGYGFKSIFGPLEASFNASNETKKLGFYMNLGYKF